MTDTTRIIEEIRAALEFGISKEPSDICKVRKTTLRALLDHITAQAERPVAVKPLKWDRQNDDGTFRTARALPGEYWALEINGTGYWAWGSMPGREVQGGLDGAKAAAQADYERRILSALAHPPTKREAGETPPLQTNERRSTHHVHRGPESLPCYCAATTDHSIGQEQRVSDTPSAALEASHE